MSHKPQPGRRPDRVTTPDGLTLAVYASGAAGAPVVVAVHGYPDDHSVWDAVAAELAADHRVVTYDVRGAGASDAPPTRDGYRLDRLAGDLLAVLDAVAPGEPVHLLAHDWGAIQTWHAVTGGLPAGRVASFTSISGPCLDHIAHWFGRRAPGARREILRQAVRSWYTLAFRIPVVPERLWGASWFRERVARGQAIPVPAVRDAVNGLELYRANIAAAMADPAERRTAVPVLVLAPTGDAFVTPAMAGSAQPYASDLEFREIPGGHWVVRHRPAEIADAVRGLVRRVPGTGPRDTAAPDTAPPGAAPPDTAPPATATPATATPATATADTAPPGTATPDTSAGAAATPDPSAPRSAAPEPAPPGAAPPGAAAPAAAAPAAATPDPSAPRAAAPEPAPPGAGTRDAR